MQILRRHRKHATRHDWSRYSERDAAVKAIGFCSYANYLVSNLWRSIRDRVLRLANWKCYACQGHANQVHHRHYDASTLRGERIDQTAMVAICGDCHQAIEIDESGRKVPAHVANKRLTKLRNKYKTRPRVR